MHSLRARAVQYFGELQRLPGFFAQDSKDRDNAGGAGGAGGAGSAGEESVALLGRGRTSRSGSTSSTSGQFRAQLQALEMQHEKMMQQRHGGEAAEADAEADDEASDRDRVRGGNGSSAGSGGGGGGELSSFQSTTSVDELYGTPSPAR